MVKRKNPKAPSPWADKPYAVGKGKPPVESQFKAGQKPPKGSGRPKGSKSRSDIEKLLDEKVQVGTDRLGRPIRRTLRNVKNRQLAKKAVEGDLAAIKILNEYELKLKALEIRNGPDAETLRKEREEEAEKQKHAAKISAFVIDVLEREARAKKAQEPRMVFKGGKLVPLERGEASPKPKTDDEEDGST